PYDCAVARLAVGAVEVFWGAGVLRDPLGPDPALLLDFSENNKAAGGAFCRSILWFVSDAFAPGPVLSFHRLPDISADPKPDHRSNHFVLRNYAAVFSRPGAVHPARRNVHYARPARLLLRH